MARRIKVDAESLRQVLEAILGPPHLIRELVAIRNLPLESGNPINQLLQDFNSAIEPRSLE